MNELAKQQKIARFLADKEMAAYVKEVMLATFLKKQSNMDVHLLASKALAIDLLQDAFRELERYKPAERSNTAAMQSPL